MRLSQENGEGKAGEGEICPLRLLRKNVSRPRYGQGPGGRNFRYHPDDERIRDSFDHAKEAGLSFEFVEDFEDKEIYPNTVDIYVTDEEGATMSLQGKSIGGGNAVITKLNGVDVELSGNYTTMIVEHIDKKGTLAFVTTVLSAYDLNIGSCVFTGRAREKIAYAIIEVDTNVKESVVSALSGFEAVRNVILVPAIKLE